MFKKFSKIAFAIVASMVLFAMTVYADENDSRVTLGADLTEDQINQIYEDFSIQRGESKEIIVTNQDERLYLSGLVPDEKIGTRSISSTYLVLLDEDEGMTVETHNIDWCTPNMYINALTTAGIYDAKIIVSAPFDVSGTAALTGLYKAYEDITGTTLSEIAKSAGVYELITTGELAEYIGSDDATYLITELKKILEETKDMTDEELKVEILSIAEGQDIQLTDDNIKQIINLSRTLDDLNVDELRQKLIQISKTMETVKKAGEGVSSFFNSVKEFFDKVGEFFRNLFGG